MFVYENMCLGTFLVKYFCKNLTFSAVSRAIITPVSVKLLSDHMDSEFDNSFQNDFHGICVGCIVKLMCQVHVRMIHTFSNCVN